MEDYLGVLDKLSGAFAGALLPPRSQYSDAASGSSFLGALNRNPYRYESTQGALQSALASRQRTALDTAMSGSLWQRLSALTKQPSAKAGPGPQNYTQTPVTPPPPGDYNFGAGVFSPFDDAFRAHAGDYAGDNMFISIVAAAALAESGFRPNAVGDNGASVGLFQMHERGAGYGMSFDERADPYVASSKMVPRFLNNYMLGLQRGYQGEELVSFVARMTERPAGYDDPNGKAANSYKAAWRRVMAGAHGV